jgi:hypothetical protein
MSRGAAITSLLARWRQAADTLRRHGAAQLADAKEADCQELEAALVQVELETLTIRKAASESGYSASQLRRMFPGQERVPRGALPRKPHPKMS